MKTNQLTLTPVQRGVYESTVAGKPAIVAFTKRNRSSEKLLGIATSFSPRQLNAARTLAKSRRLPCWIATEVMLKGNPKFTFAVPFESWPKIKVGTADFPVGPRAREAYEKDTEVLKGFSVVEQDGAEKPASPVKARASKVTTPAVAAPDVDVVNTIARAIAGDIGHDATVNLPPMTRSELFTTIQNAVSKATRTIGFQP